MGNNKGFTLVELVVVIALIALLTTFATLSWNKMIIKGAVESQIKTVHADMMSLRLEALYGKRERSVVVNGKNFMIYSSNVTSAAPISTRTFKYNFILNGTGNIITFDTSGMANGNQRTVCVDPFNDTTIVNDSYVDSIVISQARINLGKRNGNCDTSTVTQK